MTDLQGEERTEEIRKEMTVLQEKTTDLRKTMTGRSLIKTESLLREEMRLLLLIWECRNLIRRKRMIKTVKIKNSTTNSPSWKTANRRKAASAKTLQKDR